MSEEDPRDGPRVFTHEWTVRWADVDPFGIAHYPAIVVAIHDVSDRFMAQIGWSWARMAEEKGTGMPLVEIDVEFDRPLRADDVVTIELRPTLGERSARYEYVGRLEDGTVAFSGFEQRVHIGTEMERATEIPDYLREAMAPYLPADGAE